MPLNRKAKSKASQPEISSQPATYKSVVETVDSDDYIIIIDGDGQAPPKEILGYTLGRAMAILLLNPSIRLLLRNTTPVIPINNYQSLNRLNYNAPLFPHSNKKSYRAIKTRRQIRTLAIKESRISSPPNFQEPEA